MSSFAHTAPAQWRERGVRVLLVGCGGTGSQVLTHLARVHSSLLSLGHPCGLSVTVVDPDRISEANIGRQPFSPYDVGRYKAEVLVTRINQFYGFGWHHHTCGIQQMKLTRVRPDIVIGCVDSRKSRRELLNWATKHKVPYWMDCGNSSDSGQVVLGEVIPGEESTGRAKLANVADLFPEVIDTTISDVNQPSCSVADALLSQDLFINPTIAVFAGQLLWRMVRYGGLNEQGYFVNLSTGKTLPLPIRTPDAAST